MRTYSGCKGCGFDVNVDMDQFDFDREDTVSEEKYEERLDICMGCDSLLYGTTCKHSGDMVSYRAILVGKTCPFPGKGKW